MNTKLKAAVVAVGIVGAAIAGALTHDVLEQPEIKIVDRVINNTHIIDATEAQLSESFEAGANSVEPDVINNTEIVEVDNGNMELILEYQLGEDFDSEEIQEMADEAIFANETTVLAERLVESDVIKFMNDRDNDMFGENELADYRAEDVYSITVDVDESVIEDEDYKEGDANVTVEVKLKLNNGDDKLRATYVAEVEVRENELEIVDVTLKA